MTHSSFAAPGDPQPAAPRSDLTARGGTALRIAVVGAGVSGVISAKVLNDAGFDVTVFEKMDDVGGVWSAGRSYPGISTQDDRTSYTFSDSAMPTSVAEHPAGEDVRAYLERYLDDRGLTARVRLATTVTSARLVEGDVWEVESEGPEGVLTERFDWLVAANGVFSTPHVPAWPGRAEFEAAGGQVVTPGNLGDGSVVDGRRTTVVGWGKTACDVAAVAATRTPHVDVVARTLTWKYPKQLGLLGITFRHIVLTRAGERLIGTAYRDGDGRIVLRRLFERIPRSMLERVLGRAADRVGGFGALGLRSNLAFRASTSLVTEGFFEAVAEGRIDVHRERSVERLGADASGPWIELSGGERLASDLLIAATGYEQGLDFLAPEVLERLAAGDGALRLYRRVLAVDIPKLAFVGWVHNYRSPLTAEITAVWLAATLLGRVTLPSATRMVQEAAGLPISRDAAKGRHPEALSSVTMRELDRLLRDIGAPLSRRVRRRQIWTPLDPADYVRAARSVVVARADVLAEVPLTEPAIATHS